jgi:small conductance mechanosensitive channel
LFRRCYDRRGRCAHFGKDHEVRTQPTLTPGHVDYYTAMIWTWSLSFVPRLLTALLILIVGFVIASWVSRAIRKILEHSSRVDPTVRPVAAAASRYSILVIVIVAALGQLGIQTASLLAVLGAAGLAIGLALQGTLTNIAAGIMLLWLRPFRIGDYIEVPANNIAGTVKDVGLFACQLENIDGTFLFAPNGSIWNSALKNQTRIEGRLISFTVELPPAAATDKAREVLLAMLEHDPRVLKTPRPAVFLEGYGASTGATINCTFRAAHEHAAELQRDFIQEARRQLEQNNVGAPQQITRTLPAASDISRLVLS